MTKTAEITELIKNQKALILQMKMAGANFDKPETSVPRSENYFLVRIESFQDYWKQFNENHLKIASSDRIDEEYAKGKLYEEADELYTNYLTKFKDGVAKFRNSLTNENTSQTIEHQTSNNDIQLPRITIPKFDGNYRSWAAFRDLYKSMIHDNTKLSNVQKLHYLKTSVTGEAEFSLRQFEISNANYNIAWEFLEKRYNNKRFQVNTHLKILFEIPQVKSESAVLIKHLNDQSIEILHQLKVLDIATKNWDAILIYILVQKLPPETQKLWEQEQGGSTEIPEFNEFTKFLENRFRTLESLEKLHNQKHPQYTHTKATIKRGSNTLLNNIATCSKCKENHTLTHCPKFLQMSISQRNTFISQMKLCKNCLSSRHLSYNCSSTNTCRRYSKRHHTLLHIDYSINDKTGNQNSKKEEDKKLLTPNSSHTQTLLSHTKKALLATALVNVRDTFGCVHTLRAIIDSGSQASLITKSASKRLQLPQTPTDIRISGVSKKETAHASSQTNLTIESTCSPFKMDIQALIIQKITGSIPDAEIDTTKLQYLQQVKLADPQFYIPGKIDLLLGAETYAAIIDNGILRAAKPGLPTAQNTQLGWILTGTIDNTSTRISNFTISIQNNDDNLNQQLKKFWETEETYITPRMSDEDTKCEQMYQTTTVRLSDGKYKVKLPFKENDKPVLGHSRHIALKQFEQLERKFEKQPEYYNSYKQCIHEYMTMNHIKQVQQPKSTDEIAHYYMPHHAVLKESTTTKLRVVFNASAKSANGESLNGQLLTGPTIQPTLWSTLLRWRQYQYAFTADVEKMYRMILIDHSHQDYQRILWRDSPEEEIKDYALTTVTFGTTPAPYLAIRTLQQLAYDEAKDNVQLQQNILNNFYVDDNLSSFPTINEALSMQTALINTLKKGGFNLRKWCANDIKLLKDIPSEHREIKTELELSENESIKTLGIRWHPASDEFKFKVTLPSEKAIYTKRNMLSEIASLFDPLGWLAPCIVTAKMMIQRLWLLGCSWDETLPLHITSEWKQFRNECHHLEELKIPRWTKYAPSIKNAELHGFCDASTKAYAAAVYLKTGKHVTLLAAKTKVAPVKPVALPRLELCGAVLLSKLIKQVSNELNIEVTKTYVWCDSTITLSWIKGEARNWKTYVANRVAEIQENVSPTSWRYIPSTDNPTDCASRGVNPSNLLYNHLWWNGPKWLQENEQHWPVQPKFKQTTLERKNIKIHLNTQEQNFLNKFSSFSKLTRVTAYCLRFINKLKKTNTEYTQVLAPNELSNAKNKILHLLQQTVFHTEYKCLKNKHSLPANSKLLTFHPFMDNNSLIRVGGRIQNSVLPYEQKHPIILPNNHHVTKIIIDDIHKQTLHGGTQVVLNTLRNQFWLLDARNTIKNRIRHCITCYRTLPHVSTQIMGELPTARVTPALPFEHTGVDYAGPIMIKTSSLRNAKISKGYICLFICLATKAIHIELTTDMTTAGFFTAFKRFTSRRGTCQHMYSDCGTNFIGANAILQNHNNNNNTENITWHFNPPAAPHFGGLWEAGVKLVKTHLKRVIGNTNLTYEELSTILCQIEAAVNSRPLTPLSNDPNDHNYLTPGHFLTGRNLYAASNSPLDVHIPLKRWQHMQELYKQFWKNWSQNYIRSLQQRQKWKRAQPEIKEGDIVLLKDQNIPTTKWKLGKITQVFHGNDKHVRVVKIQTENSTLTRPVTAVCKLPINP